MARGNPTLVTLKVPGDQLRALDFSGCPELEVKRPKKRGGARPRVKKEVLVANSASLPESSAGNGTATTTTTTPAVTTIDPVMASLPRSLKAAPVANTNGLNLNKTPCRKWQWRPLQINTFSGFSCHLWGWTSDYTPAEFEAQKKRDLLEAEKEAQAMQERELVKQEALKQEALKQEAQKQEALRKEAAKAELTNAKAAKRAAKKEERASKTRKSPEKRQVLCLKLKTSRKPSDTDHEERAEPSDI